MTEMRPTVGIEERAVQMAWTHARGFHHLWDSALGRFFGGFARATACWSLASDSAAGLLHIFHCCGYATTNVGSNRL